MAKTNRTDNATIKGRPTPTGKSRSRVPVAKMQSAARPTVEPVRTGWATDLVFDVREPKLAVSLRLDADVLRFFRDFGAGYQTRINEVLKAFMQARSTSEAIPRAVLGARAGRGLIGNGKRAR
jgi:uncharacterized protein (DUF4415 family)